MIHSIEFKKDVKKGYIFNKKTKKVLRKNYKDWTPEQIESFIETEKKRTGSKFCLGRNPYDYFYYEVSDGYANPQLIKNLVGRKITFEKDKINVLFGPNASGKTTIIKTIARYCLCGDTNNCDGYTNVVFTGRVAPNKKQEDLIASFYYYNKYINPKSRLIIVGRYDIFVEYYNPYAFAVENAEAEYIEKYAAKVETLQTILSVAEKAVAEVNVAELNGTETETFNELMPYAE